MSVGPAGSPFDAHSPEAHAIAGLFAETLVVCAVIGAVVAGLVGYCVVRFRAGRRPGEPTQVSGNTGLEIAWTLIPLAIVVGLFVRTAQAMGVSDPPHDRDADVVVTGHQWWWEARYASGALAANEIHIPVGKDLLVRVESADVVHDFWVPQLARKMDAVPGHPSFVWMQADTSGTYLGACAEYCGAQHAWMRIVVVAEPQAEFDAWERHQREPAAAPATEAATRGARDFATKTCVKCHAIGGPGEQSRVAPDLTHLAQRGSLGAGVLGNTPANLSRWLSDPQGVKPGSHMPDAQLTDAEVSDLVAYFETLR
jgi:cytochrome c oxidase subunit II